MKSIFIFLSVLAYSLPIFRVDVVRDIWDVVVQIATVLTASISVYLAYRVYVWTKQDTESQTEQQRKLEMLKTLVLDYRMNLFYQFIDQISTNAEKLITCSSMQQRKVINEELLTEFYGVRLRFVETLKIVDNDLLYTSCMKILDDLSDSLSDTISKEEVDFSQEPVFREKIKMPIYSANVEILRILFSYTGCENLTTKGNG